jgi:hypothetical protein
MNPVAKEDAMCYLKLADQDHLTSLQERQLRAKKQKIITSTKKMDRRISREVTRQADRLE